MPSQKEELNFLLVPLMAPGHIIPMIDMAKVLAQHGVMATIITTTMNAIRFEAVINRAAESGLPIRLLQLQFPSEEVGLPKGCESVDNLPSYGLVKNLHAAIAMLQQPIEKMMEALSPSPCCVICDKHFPWASQTFRKYRIPWISFDGTSCFTQLCSHILRSTKVHETAPEGQPFVVPNLPHKIEFTKSQLPQALNPAPRSEVNEIRERIMAGETEAYGVVVNSFEELEETYVDEVRKLKGGKVWCVGPLSLCNKDNLDKAQRGSEAVSVDREQRLMTWLESWQSGTVVYASLGSLSRLTLSEFVELALGLEASKHPFMLAVRGERAEEIERWILEEGFEERTKERGVLIRGWAPQLLILSHPAIGGFLTHSGWNSTMEGICAGVPMITLPFFGEQFFNEKQVVQILKTGLGVGAKACRHLGEEEKLGMGVTRHEIERAICRVMDKDSKEGIERRERAKELGKMAKKAVEEGGSSYQNVSLLIQDIKQLAFKEQ